MKAAKANDKEIIKILLNMGANTSAKNREGEEGKTARMFAEKFAHWSVAQQLIMAEMGEKSGEVQEHVRSIAASEEMAEKLINSSNKELLDEITNNVIRDLRARVAFQDYFLLVAWKHAKNKFPNAPLESELWVAMKETLELVLDWGTISSDKRNWFWFKTFLMNSSL